MVYHDYIYEFEQKDILFDMAEILISLKIFFLFLKCIPNQSISSFSILLKLKLPNCVLMCKLLLKEGTKVSNPIYLGIYNIFTKQIRLQYSVPQQPKLMKKNRQGICFRQANIQIQILHQNQQMKASHTIDFSEVIKKCYSIYMQNLVKSKQLVYKFDKDVDLTIFFHLNCEKHESKTQNLLQIPDFVQKDIFNSTGFVHSPKSKSKSIKTITWLDEKIGNEENTQPNLIKNQSFLSIKEQEQSSTAVNKCKNCIRLQKLLNQSKKKEVGLMEKLVVSQIVPSSKNFLGLSQQPRQHFINLQTQNQNLKRQNFQLKKQLTAISSEKDRFYQLSQIYLEDTIKNKQKIMTVINLILQNSKSDEYLLHIVNDVLYKM